jgi:hypothetical protein
VSLNSKHSRKLLRIKSRKLKIVNHFDMMLIEDREPLSREYHARLSIEQLYEYMVFDKILYGILTTFNSFMFFKR